MTKSGTSTWTALASPLFRRLWFTYRWHLYEDLNQPNKFRMEVVVPFWKQHLLQRERMTKNEREVIDKLRDMRIDLAPIFHSFEQKSSEAF